MRRIVDSVLIGLAIVLHSDRDKLWICSRLGRKVPRNRTRIHPFIRFAERLPGKSPFQYADHYQFWTQEPPWTACWASLPLESATLKRITIKN